MRTKLFCVAMVMTLMSAALLITYCGSGFMSELVVHAKRADDGESSWPTRPSWTTRAWWTTPGYPGTNLNGKMFTLSANGGGIRLYPTYFRHTPYSGHSATPYRDMNITTQPYTTPSLKTRPYTTPRPKTRPYTTPSLKTRPYTTPRPKTRPYTTPRPKTRPYRTTRYPYWTTASPYRGVSVCLRYLAAAHQAVIRTLFTLSPSTTPLTVGVEFPDRYFLPINPYYYTDVYLTPSVRFWSNLNPEVWTRVCLTVDTERNVAQLFSGSNMSTRRILPSRYLWSGEPVIDIPGFDGQVTDVQMWDYPLRYKEVFNYMTRGFYVPYRGSVITWSSISYSLERRGQTLLEDIFEKQGIQPISSRQGKSRRPKGERKGREFVHMVQKKEEKKEWFK
ncbi:uncharacterized protein LOC121507487 [Cheilinus undulatus]|uniref:uncharacterized protein LOC121507487 n=1 Tax=Cheilinus undulatus TaxID=241271 RepID=UPI001BD1CB2A|nr:uncharacterized protein LOC121507487 [Cheilinus undulatus]